MTADIPGSSPASRSSRHLLIIGYRKHSVLPEPGTPFNKYLAFPPLETRVIKCSMNFFCVLFKINSFSNSRTSTISIPSNEPSLNLTFIHLPLNSELLKAIDGKKKIEVKVETPKEPEPEKIPEEKKKIKLTADDIMKAKKEQDRDLFEKTLPLILKYEGGYVNDPDDPGGETNKGIIKTTYDAYRKDKGLAIRNVSEIDDDEVEDIYYNEYWLRGSCDKVFDDLAITHFDSCVNTGIKQSAKFLQRSCGASDDGVIGPKTLQAVEATDKKVMIEKYFVHRNTFYENLAQRKPNMQKFLKGWLKRVAHLEQHIKDRENDNKESTFA